MSREKRFLKYVKEMTLLDLLGIGRLVGAVERQNFNDYLMDIVICFNKQDIKKQEEMIKMMKKIAKDNRKNGDLDGKQNVSQVQD